VENKEGSDTFTPVSPKSTEAPTEEPEHYISFLFKGGTAEIGEGGNQQPCWISLASLNALEEAEAIHDTYGERKLFNTDAIYLQRGEFVRRLQGDEMHLRIESGPLEGTECWEPDGMYSLFTHMKMPANL
jgi:hypothetical protein